MSRTNHDTSPGRLRGRTIVLTGAGGNVGQALSRVVQREGARLVVTSRSRDNLDALVATLTSEGLSANQVFAIAANPADPADCERVTAGAVSQFDAIDALVNNPDSSGPVQPLERIPFTAADLASLGGTEPPPFGVALAVG